MIFMTMRELYARTRKIKFALATATAEQSVQLHSIQNRLVGERRTILQHAVAAYCTTLMFIPVLAWLVSPSHSFLFMSVLPQVTE